MHAAGFVDDEEDVSRAEGGFDRLHATAIEPDQAFATDRSRLLRAPPAPPSAMPKSSPAVPPLSLLAGATVELSSLLHALEAKLPQSTEKPNQHARGSALMGRGISKRRARSSGPRS
jgi:hypothetical protein